MRLTCPNCGAQYEVPDEVIPESGRDVQCSNCGDTWFQHHPDHAPAEEDDAANEPHPGWDSPEEEPEQDFAPEPDEEDAPEAEPEFDHEPEPEPVAEDAPEDEADPEWDSEPEPEPEDTSEPEREDFATLADDAAEDEDDIPDFIPREDPAPQRRGLDPAVADVLREEAAREQDARAGEGIGLETQPDLGLDAQSEEEDQRSQEARSRMARLRGLPEEGDDDALEPDPALISRRNLLPDIDEINSSLDSESARAEQGDAVDSGVGPEAAAARKSGFNRGFMRIVLLAVILVVLYVMAPAIAEKVPALSGALTSYVSTVNEGRVWLNDLVGGLMAPQ